MRLLFITQKVDRDDWLLGFTHGWLKALAARVDRLKVICLEQGATELPPNVEVVSLRKERGAGRGAQAMRLARALAESMGEVDGVFAHMSPIFAIAAAPFAKMRRIPLVMWYTHRHVDFKLRLATALCDAVATASPESFQLDSSKVRVLGHGIDGARFASARCPDSPPLVVSIGRLSPIKRHELLIEAVTLLRERGVHLRCVIIGSVPPGDETYARKVKTQGEGIVEFAGAVPFASIAAWYGRSAAAVNLCPTGGVDKAVLEAMFCACPIVVTNKAFSQLLGAESQSWLVADNASAVAGALAEIVSDAKEAQMRADTVRARAVSAHSLDGLAGKMVDVFANLR